MIKIQKFAKALVPVVVAIILALLSKAGVNSSDSVSQAITLLITGGLVYLVPNKQ